MGGAAVAALLGGYGCKQVIGWEEPILMGEEADAGVDAGEGGSGGSGGAGGSGGTGGSGGMGGCTAAKDCPGGLNAAGTCEEGVCGLMCETGFGDCDGMPGCETSTVDNKEACGACGTTCAAYCKGTGCNDPVYVAASDYHHCAILKDGSLYCWGRNENGEIGDGSVVSKTLPVKVALPQSALQVEASPTHTCAVLADRTVMCWGVGNKTPQAVLGLKNIKEVATGTGYACAVDLIGTLFCWGNNVHGQLGTGDETYKPIPVQIMTGVLQVSAGYGHTCAVKAGGTLQCWGHNNQGQLGIGSTTDKASPTDVPGQTGVLEVRCGGGHTCSRNATAMSCWGGDSQGQLGTTPGADDKTPQLVNLIGVQSLALGLTDTGAITADGVFMWGANQEGQLGNGTKTGSGKPIAPALQDSMAPSMLALGGYSSCMLAQTGAIYCWGGNAYGQLGNGTTTGALTPTPVIWP